MTYKYFEVRQNIYENCSNKSLKKYRTFKEMKALFKKKTWIIFSVMLLCLLVMLIISLTRVNNIWGLIPATIFIIISDITKFNFEKLYNKEARKKELSENNLAYMNM